MLVLLDSLTANLVINVESTSTRNIQQTTLTVVSRAEEEDALRRLSSSRTGIDSAKDEEPRSISNKQQKVLQTVSKRQACSRPPFYQQSKHRHAHVFHLFDLQTCHYNVYICPSRKGGADLAQREPKGTPTPQRYYLFPKQAPQPQPTRVCGRRGHRLAAEWVYGVFQSRWWGDGSLGVLRCGR